jgi:endonuclease/exonuclease/phosphatase family metal-dependent hydrolase
MKIIQLNAWKFKFLNEMVAFLKAEKPDIINLQEVSSGKFNNHNLTINEPFEFLKKELGMNGIFAPFTGLKSDDGTFSESGNGFLTNLEIVDYGVIFEKTLPPYTVYSDNDDLIKTTLENDKTKYYNVFNEPKNLIWSVLKKDGKYIRNLTTHFTASYNCTETLQMLNQTQSILDYLKYTKNIPTIFSGDLNIHPKSASVAKLSQNLKLVNVDGKNTLNPLVHPAFKNNFPKGVNVDYIFQKGFEVINYQVPEITVSDHLPVVAELELV